MWLLNGTHRYIVAGRRQLNEDQESFAFTRLCSHVSLFLLTASGYLDAIDLDIVATINAQPSRYPEAPRDNLIVMDSELEGSASLEAVVSALIPTLIVGLAITGAFFLVRRRFPMLYTPRTFLGTIPEEDRTPSVGYGLDWLHNMRKLPDKFLLHHESMDAYLYLRFLRTIIFICVVGCVLTWPILMPVNATGGGSSTELDRITISNVNKANHLYVHAVMAWVFLGFVMFTITRERLRLVSLRQAWTLSIPNSKRLSSRIVLILSATEDAFQQNVLNESLSSGIVRIWPITKPDTLKELQTLVSERDDLIEKLESAEALLIHKASSLGAHEGFDGKTRYMLRYSDIPDLVKMGMRLRSRSKNFLFGSYFGLSRGEKVDTVQSLRDMVKEKVELIREVRRSHYNQGPHGTAAVFVEFKTQAEAQQAFEKIVSPNTLTLTPKYLGVKPSEIIWDNLNIPPLRRVSQQGVALAMVVSAIIFWSVPSGLVGIVSNVSYLAENFESLGFLNDLPGPLNGLLTGLVPPLLTNYVTKDVPVLFRSIFTSYGGPLSTVNELNVQRWGHVFQVTQVFLVTAVFSGAATVASQLAENLRNPTAIPALLATQLPKSSNFYLTYFVVQAITCAADSLLNYSDLLNYLSLEYLVDETPRQKFKRNTTMKDIAWGQVFPKFTNFVVIAIAYSCIAPLVLGFAAAGLSLYYLSYRYNLFYVMKPKIDTQGQAYTLALRHLIVGVYIAELALIGICGLHKAKGPSTIIGLLFILTIVYNVAINRYISRLEGHLTGDVTSFKARDEESMPLLSAVEEGQGTFISSSNAKHGTQTEASKPSVFAPYGFLDSWVREGRAVTMEDHEVPKYTDEELTRAYLHPALTSPTPVIWMPRDLVGASKAEVRETEECGLRASDEGAWLDESRIVRWDVPGYETLPVWKKVVPY
ncbi:hypothetical protein F5Y08DRAFT_351372 [Xylaria arbuscula]|nr:hypothetical protein F5Y08DRAFT_351372 [Xylaria arbuscula]